MRSVLALAALLVASSAFAADTWDEVVPPALVSYVNSYDSDAAQWIVLGWDAAPGQSPCRSGGALTLVQTYRFSGTGMLSKPAPFARSSWPSVLLVAYDRRGFPIWFNVKGDPRPVEYFGPGGMGWTCLSHTGFIFDAPAELHIATIRAYSVNCAACEPLIGEVQLVRETEADRRPSQ
jgi:hypothetical protein